jgi:RNA polymerase sigma factor (sigma-70 family)
MASSEVAWLAANACREQLLRAGLRAGLDRQDAEDVASEAILRAAAKPDLDVDRVHSWLKVVANNLAADVVRRRRGREWLTRLHHYEPQPAPPSDRVDEVSEAEWVAQLVGTLPPRQRLVLEHRASGRSPREIAQIMGCTDKMVESLTSRARKTVRTALAATLGALAPILGFARRGSTAATVPALALVCFLAVAPPYGAPPSLSDSPLERRTPDSPTRSTAVAEDRRSAQQLSMAGTPSARPAAPATTAVAAAPSRQRVGGVDVGIASYTGAEHTRAEGDRTLIQSVGDCIKRGLVVTPTHVGCRQDEQRRTASLLAYNEYEEDAAATEHDHDTGLPRSAGAG